MDTREQQPLPLTRFRSVRTTLLTGDYSFAGGSEAFAVERKSIADLVGSLTANRQRFARELHRLRGFHFKRLLIVGRREEIENHGYRSKANPKAILASLGAFEIRYGIPVVWSETPETAAALVEEWVWWYARELVVQANALTRKIGREAA